MQLESLNIANFKSFTQREFTFNPEFNLIIGINGSGKTSILNAVAVALAAWSRSYMPSDIADRPIEVFEVREFFKDNQYLRSPSATIKATAITSIVDARLEKKDGRATWSREWKEGQPNTSTQGTIQYQNRGSFSDQYPLRLDSYKENIFKHLESAKEFDLPLFAFYGCDRLWYSKPGQEDNEQSATARYTRFDGYAQCFHTGAASSDVVKWLIKHALASSQQKNSTAPLQVIREAARAGLENCEQLDYDFEQSRVIVIFNDGSQIAYEHLSEGQRTMLGLFCDIARRASLLNPHLGLDACKQTKGVVLIDELDLHLHPTWQRSIIEKLRTIFPKIQFICTTHSPFLIQSLRSGDELLMIEGEATATLGNRSLEEIATYFMGVKQPETSLQYQEQLDSTRQIITLLNDIKKSPAEKLAEYKSKLQKSGKLFASNPALQAILEVQKTAQTGS
jgi:predicted ATP-binding protein involved in virulence